MNNYIKPIVIGLLLSVFSGCVEEEISPLTDLQKMYGNEITLSSEKTVNKEKQSKVTGLVQIIWKGGKGVVNGDQQEAMLAFAGFEAFEGTDPETVKGTFIYQVATTDFIVHREVKAQLKGIVIDPVNRKSWMVGEVISDTRGCAGNGNGDHDPGCQGGACSGHDSGGHDGGCSGSDGTDHSGGCSDNDGTDHTDGGCSNPDHSTGDHTTGGCSGSDGTDHSDGGCSNPDHSDGSHTDGGCSGSDHSGGGSGDTGGNVKGKHCRIGQIIAVKCHDGSTPGTNGDGITWKWFSADNAPDITDPGSWPHLCKKSILEGNIKIHVK